MYRICPGELGCVHDDANAAHMTNNPTQPRGIIMTTTSSASNASRAENPQFLGHVHFQIFPYRTITIYSDLAEVDEAISVLNREGFTPDQISLLGREQENWREKLNTSWKVTHTAKGAAAGAAMGLIPGMVLVTGVALSGGAGILAVGPMVSAMAALGMGALGGGLMGGAVSNLDRSQQFSNIRDAIEDAIGRGQWVVIAHCHDKAEAMRAQSLLPNSRISREPD